LFPSKLHMYWAGVFCYDCAQDDKTSALWAAVPAGVGAVVPVGWDPVWSLVALVLCWMIASASRCVQCAGHAMAMAWGCHIQQMASATADHSSASHPNTPTLQHSVCGCSLERAQPPVRRAYPSSTRNA